MPDTSNNTNSDFRFKPAQLKAARKAIDNLIAISDVDELHVTIGKSTQSAAETDKSIFYFTPEQLKTARQTIDSLLTVSSVDAFRITLFRPDTPQVETKPCQNARDDNWQESNPVPWCEEKPTMRVDLEILDAINVELGTIDALSTVVCDCNFQQWSNHKVERYFGAINEASKRMADYLEKL